MRKCNAQPYEGDKPYIFISYAHKDSGMVYPVIEYLVSKGYRIWYDNGIHPGSEWLESIGEHLNRCEVFMSFISPRSLSSHNCKNEFNYASMENKKSISVVLEPVQMSIALKMQMASIQGIMRYEYDDYSQYLSKFLQADILKPCLGSPNSDIVISRETPYEEEKTEENKKKFNWFKNEGTEGKDIEIVELKEDIKSDTDSEVYDDGKTVYIDEEESDGCTVTIDEDRTQMFRQVFVLTRRGTGEKVAITHTDFTIGRKCKDGQADYMFEDKIKSVSRKHMSFILDGDKCLLRDNGALNGTTLNGERLEKGKDYAINDGDVVIMGYDGFTFDVSVQMESV